MFSSPMTGEVPRRSLAILTTTTWASPSSALPIGRGITSNTTLLQRRPRRRSSSAYAATGGDLPSPAASTHRLGPRLQLEHVEARDVGVVEARHQVHDDAATTRT